jgi:alpha-glucosidase
MTVQIKPEDLADAGKQAPSEWWRSAVTYQIYVRSFYDSDGDGNGDLNGIVEKMNYLEYLGVDSIWLNPFFKSPGRDQGYDPASYHKVDRKFTRLSDEPHFRPAPMVFECAHAYSESKAC